MPLPLQKYREAVFQILYAQDFEFSHEEDLIPFMMNELKTTRRAMADAHLRVAQVLARLTEIDPLIASASTEYSFERISRVELTILRLGLFEILFDDKIPSKVAIAEAIRLCRKFGTPESSQFVNAILDRILKNASTPAEPLPV